jgi:hypothetical protein
VVGTLENFWPGRFPLLCSLLPGACCLLFAVPSSLSLLFLLSCLLFVVWLLSYLLLAPLSAVCCLLSVVCSSGTLKNFWPVHLSCLQPRLNSCLLSYLYAPLSLACFSALFLNSLPLFPSLSLPRCFSPSFYPDLLHHARALASHVFSCSLACLLPLVSAFHPYVPFCSNNPFADVNRVQLPSACYGQ